MRTRWLLALIAVMGLCGTADAQAKNNEPTVELRVRSVKDLLDKAEYVAGLAAQEEAIRGVREFVKSLTVEGKGIQGINPDQPFGLTATLTQDVIDSPILVMVPISDQKQFLSMLSEQLGITPEKQDDGTYKADVPLVNALYLRFANDYLYIGRSADDVDLKSIPVPKKFFAKDDDSIASATVHVDRIPEDLRTLLIGQLELAIAEQRKNNADNESPTEKVVLDWLSEHFTDGVKTLLNDAKQITVRAFIDEKSDELSGELILTSKAGTTLAKNVAGLAGRKSLPAGVVNVVKDASVKVSGKAGLPDGVKKDLDKVVDAAIVEITKSIEKLEDREGAKLFLDKIAPTLKAGEMDLAMALTTPDAKGHCKMLAAIEMVKVSELEALIKLVALLSPEVNNAAELKFNVEKIGDYNLHKITLKNAPPEFESFFGTTNVWVAASNNLVVVSIEEDGKLLREGLKAKPIEVPVMTLDLSATKLMRIFAKHLAPDELKAILVDAFPKGDAEGKDTLSVTITGGEKLTVKGKLKGKAVRLVADLFQLGAN